MICEICGKDVEHLYSIELEGAKLKVCAKCKKMGKEIKPIQIKQSKRIHTTLVDFSDSDFQLIENYGQLIKRKREQMGLTQKQFAMFLSERESIIHKIENHEILPNIQLVRKIEHKLGIKLIVKDDVKYGQTKVKQESTYTLGDLIKIKSKNS